eukprot:CAMPEP_0179410306 /NCGR_PEP_ID=MMETSP0799-20121207/3211_1 /TAXON_ID=46947 /ORGANISM="Geminigera cryophila, Strain CCMP2564" /LENGTH=490 /DNA_ID=CAMNT_0021182135 /DNA_START=65 /DNA_END=1537 /DNA_ORIENTATION=+
MSDTAKPSAAAGKDNTHEEQGKLKRELNAFDLTVLGVGGIVGAGIFVVSGEAAYKYAGPAVILSFALAGVCSSVYAVCFAELAAMVPHAGSAYTYCKTAFGNLVGFIVGWCLLAEYIFTISAVAVGWAGYFTSMLGHIGWAIPESINAGPFLFDEVTQEIVLNEGHIVNLPASLLVLLTTAIICIGVRKSAMITTVAVCIKLTVIVVFVAFGIWYVKWENLRPFIPEEDKVTGFGHYGWSGIVRGASVVFFAYIGFDAVTAAAAETEDPATMMPIGIFASLGISTGIYMLVSFVMVGLAPYTLLGVPDPIVVAVQQAGPALAWLVPLISIAVVCGLPGVVLVSMYANSRIVLLMAQDGMLPSAFADINTTFNTPHWATLCCGLVASVVAGLFPIGVLAEVTSMGTLLAFALVCGGVVMLRHSKPDLPRPFLVPFSPYVPILGVFLAIGQIGFLPWTAWVRMIAWLLLGAVMWGFYGNNVTEPDGVYTRVD